MRLRLRTACLFASLVLSACSSAQEVSTAEQVSTTVAVVDWTELLKNKPLEVINSAVCEPGYWRDDSLRCWVGNEIVGPCFHSKSGAVCPQSPWSDEYRLLKAKTSKPTSAATSEGDPWGIVLTNGARCQFLGGATMARDDLRNSYECDDGKLLWGEPTRAGVWRMKASDDLYTKFFDVQIKKVIY